MEQSPSETAAATSPPKKKRGRPKKEDKQLLRQKEAGVAAQDGPKVRRKRTKSFLKSSVPVVSEGREERLQQGMSPLATQISDSDADVPENEERTVRADVNVGQQVHGVVDGVFDAGYLVTVRVGDTETVFRGVVFGPGLSLPPDKENDVAPKLKRMQNLDNAISDVHAIAPTTNIEGAEAPVASTASISAIARAPANSASVSISPTLAPPANEARGAVTMATGMGVPRAPISSNTPPPPLAYSPAATYRSPLFVQSPLQNASGGFYCAQPSHTPNPNSSHGHPYYPPRGFPAYAFQYPTTAEFSSGASQLAGPPPLTNMQGTLQPRPS